MSHCGFLLFRVREALARMVRLEPEILRLIIEAKVDRKLAVEMRKQILDKLVELKKEELGRNG